MANIRIKDQATQHTSGGLAGVQMAVDHSSWASGRRMGLDLLGLGSENVLAHGALGNGTGNDGPAFQSAINAANAASPKKSVYVPGGRSYRITQALTCPVRMWSDSNTTVLQWPTDLGAGQYAITMTASPSPSDRSELMNFRITGPSGAGGLGTKPANMGGVRCGQNNTAAKPYLEGLHVTGFHSGIVFDNTDGHMELYNVNCEGNYYGFYVANGNGDTRMIKCHAGGNRLAGIAMPATEGLGGGFYVYQGSFGFQPYGIYQEPYVSGTRAPFIQDGFLQTRFESMGNGAIISHSTPSGENPGFLAVTLEMAGFSWNAGFRITTDADGRSHNRNYAVSVPHAEGINRFYMGTFPFEAGDVSMIHAVQGGGGFWIYYTGRNGPSGTIMSGDAGVISRSRYWTKNSPNPQTV